MDGLLLIYIMAGLLVSASWISDVYHERQHEKDKKTKH